jgi:hypothetical protein
VTRACAWCGKREADGERDLARGAVSHTICEACLERFVKEEEMRFSFKHFALGFIAGFTLGVLRAPFRSLVIAAALALAFGWFACYAV